MPLLVSVSQTQELLGGVSRDTIYRMLASGTLASIKIGRRRMVLASSIHSFVQAASVA